MTAVGEGFEIDRVVGMYVAVGRIVVDLTDDFACSSFGSLVALRRMLNCGKEDCSACCWGDIGWVAMSDWCGLGAVLAAVAAGNCYGISGYPGEVRVLHC